MYIMTLRPWTRVSVQAPFRGVTDWYPEPCYREPAPSSEFLLAPVVAPPGIRRRPAILVRLSEAIPFGRPYRTHLNRPRKLLTARKRVGPFPARRLAWRRVSHRSSDRHSSPDFTLDISSGSSSDSLSGSSSVHSSGQSHSGPSTRVASPRLLIPRLGLHDVVRLLCVGEMQIPTTLVPSSTPVSRSIAPALADLLPRKRFKDSYSSKVNGEEHREIGTVDAETVANLGISQGVGAHIEDCIDLGVEVATSDIRRDEEEFEAEASEGGMMEITVDPLATGDISKPTRGDAPDLEGTLYDMSHYMSEVPLNRITEFETAQRQLEAEHDYHLFWYYPWEIEELVNRQEEEALAAYEATRAANALEAKSQSQNGSDGNNGNGGNRNSGNGNPNENERGARPVARECTYQDFMKCQPLNFKGMEGVVGLIRWFKKMETVFHISNCPEKYQVKYATFTLLIPT
ncbi:hypothetical protein Tco_1063241 [Tanacetum coccineum]